MSKAALIRDVFEGRYEASRQLGEGGFGQVYLARQVATGQEVAIKLLQLKHNKAIETQVARFQREMKLCADLHHPNIVRLIDSGQLGDDVLATVFEYVPGETLGDVLNKGGLDPREATHLMMQVLDALGCAHAAGIVHRDLKPQNIMVTSTGLRRNAMVLDFGIGGIVEAARLEEFGRLTKTNELLGTPAYAAPEQLRGQAPSTRSDLYSWGLVFLECLTGEQAIKADSIGELLARQSGPEPVPIPSWLRSHHIGRVLGRVLVKQVERRAVEAAEIMRELERREVAGSNLEALAGFRQITGEGERVEPDSASGTLMESFDLERHLFMGERRQVTALCCTLAVARPSADLELREYLGVVQSQQRIWSEILRAHDGYFGGAIGDRFLLYFGYPLAREDDVGRAVRCALAIVAATREQAERISGELGVEVSVSVGVHTDLVVTQMMSSSMIYSDVVGLTAVVAERIVAPANTVVVSEATREVLRDRFVFELAGEVRCTERSAASKVYRVVQERAATGEADNPFVGRSHELALLEHRWELATRGEGQTLLLTAEAGVGKSRLARELHRRLPADGHRRMVCRCAQEGRNSSFAPIIEMFEQLLASRVAGISDVTDVGQPGEGLSEGQRANALDRLLEELELEDESFQLLAGMLGITLDPQRYPPLTLTADRKRELTINAVIAVLLELSEQQPLLFVIEDVHWADPTTLTLLEQLFTEVGTASLCVILTARPEFETESSLEFMSRVRLTPLAKAEIAEFIANLDGELAPELVQQIIERSDGVPLFVEELTRVLVDGGAGKGDDVPSTLRDALTARIDQLGPAKSTVHVASALGREFSGDLFERVAAELGNPELAKHVDALHDAGLLARKRRRGVVLYSFKHALIRDAAHSAMLPEDRRSVHATTARVLEQHFGKVVAKRPEILAMHHRLGGQTREAVKYALMAATQAMVSSAHIEAAAHAKEALTWLPDLTNARERAEAELDLNGVLTRIVMISQGYGTVDTEALLRRSELLISQLMAEGGTSKHVYPNLASFGLFHLVRGNMAAALQIAHRLVALGREAGDTGQEVYGLSFLGQCALFEAQYASLEGSCRRALELFDPVAHFGHTFEYGFDSKVNIDTHLASGLTLMGRIDSAHEHAKAARERAAMLNIPHVGFATLFALACMYQMGADRDSVIRISDEMRALAAAQGGSWYVWLVETQRAWAEGRREPVVGHVAMLRSFDAGFARAYWCVMLAELDVEAGEFDSGLEAIAWALNHIDDGSRYMLPEMHRLRARLLAGKGREHAEDALAAVNDALVSAREAGALLFELRAALEQVRIEKLLDLPLQGIDTLRAVSERFVEGHDHHEVIEAKAVLSNMNTSAGGVGA